MTRKASAEVVAPTTSMQIMAMENLSACGFASFRSRLKMSTSHSSLILCIDYFLQHVAGDPRRPLRRPGRSQFAPDLRQRSLHLPRLSLPDDEFPHLGGDPLRIGIVLDQFGDDGPPGDDIHQTDVVHADEPAADGIGERRRPCRRRPSGSPEAPFPAWPFPRRRSPRRRRR